MVLYLEDSAVVVSLKSVHITALVLVAALASSTASMMPNASLVDGVAAQSEDYVHMGALSSVIYWNPLYIQMVEDYVVTSLVYSYLFTYDQDWEGPVNDLATGYWQELHANGSMATYINVTTSAYFRSIDNIDDTSHPLDARDVSYTYNLIKNNSGGTFDWYLEELSYFTALESVPDSGVWDRVSTWCSYQNAILIDDISAVPILPMYLWGPDGENYEARALGAMDPSEQVGSGPFVFEDWVRDSWYMFKTAPNYHGEADYGPARTVSIPGVLYNVVSDTQAMCIEINSGVLDCGVLTGDLHAFEDVLGVGASVNVYKAAVAENGITDIAINALPDCFDDLGYLSRHVALQDPFVRKAIFMTLNKDYVVNVIMHGLPIRAASVIQPGFWQAEIENEITYDPAGAKAMLEANGWADSDEDGWLEATATAYGVQEGLFPEGTELSGIRCQAINTDPHYGEIAVAWPGWAELAGIELIGSIESEATMVNMAWYAADYDIWIWHWGWGPEPIGGALSVWLTSEIEKAGANCQMPMGPWWCHGGNISVCPYVDQDMIDKYDIMNTDTWDGRFSAFDQNITDAMRILDANERKVVLDKLQQWIYDSYCELPPYYELGLFAYNDCSFDNWGDFTAHPGRTFTSGLCWLWYDLQPVGANTPPVASFEASPSTGGVDEVFSFDASASSDEEDSSASLEVRWDWENNSVWDTIWSTDKTEQHQYTEEGEYTIRLEVMDTGLLTSNATRQIIVDETPPIADAGPDQNVAEDTIVALDGSGSTDNIGIANYSWSFIEIIDGNEVETYLMGEHSTIVFENPGEYIITLMVLDFTGLWDTDNVTIRVADTTPPTADAGPDQTVDEDTLVTFDGSSSSDNVDIVNYTWTFTDGTAKTLYGVSPTYAFVTPGTYEIILNVSDADGNHAEDNVTITVLDATDPIADAGADQTIEEGDSVEFDGSNSTDNTDIVNYTFTFTYEGYTVELYGETPTFRFDRAGVYTVTLTVKDAAGLTETDVVEITVEEKAGISMLAVGAIGIIIVAIVALAVFMMIRKKKPPHET